MKLRLHHSVVILAAAAMPFAATLGASAQNINFTCGTGTVDAVMLVGVSGNACPNVGGVDTGAAVPDAMGVNNQPLKMVGYTTPIFQVVNSQTPNGYTYNVNNGNAGVGDPSAGASKVNPSLNLNSSANSITVAAGGSFFLFKSVDLLNGSANGPGTITYTITGYDNGTQEFQLMCGGAMEPACPTAASTTNTITNTIAGSSDVITSLTIQSSDSNYGWLDDIDVVYVPEGGAAIMFLLLAGGACFGAMGFRSRQLAV